MTDEKFDFEPSSRHICRPPDKRYSERNVEIG